MRITLLEDSAAQLDAYTAVVTPNQLSTLAEQGLDITSQRSVAGGVKVGLVLSEAQRARLADDGIRATLTRVKGGLTVQQFAARQAANGFQVWRSYDEPGGSATRCTRSRRRAATPSSTPASGSRPRSTGG